MSELKPCPLPACNGAADIDYDDNGYKWIVCTRCGLSSDTVHAQPIRG